MSIKIESHYRPFSQLPGTAVMLPSSSWYVTSYPKRFELKNIDPSFASSSVVVDLLEAGPMREFTVMQNLDRGWVRISGHLKKGYLSYRLLASGHEIVLFMERCPKEGVSFCWNNHQESLQRKEELIFPVTSPAFSSTCREKMHFGCYKAQNWPLIKSRLSLSEVLPLYFEIGKKMAPSPSLDQGTMQLLTGCRKLIEEKNRVAIGTAFLDLFLASFDGIFVPRLEDRNYQGLTEGLPSKPISPLALLSEGASLIRSLFVELKDSSLFLLPCLPVELHAGRTCDIKVSPCLSLDIEWSKKMLRRVVLHSQEDQKVQLKLPTSIHTFRFSPSSSKKRGKSQAVTQPLELKKGERYLLDRFQK